MDFLMTHVGFMNRTTVVCMLYFFNWRLVHVLSIFMQLSIGRLKMTSPHY